MSYPRPALFATAAALLLVGAGGWRPAAAQNGAAPPPAAQIQLRLDQLGDEIRDLTGQNETLAHQVQVLTQQLEKLRTDTDLRLNDLEGKNAAAIAPDAGEPAAPGPTASAPPSAQPTAPGGAPKVLGTIPAGSVPAGSPAAAAPAAAANTSQPQYEAAFAAFGQGNYGDADKGFKAYLAQHPKDALASGAAFYIGESAFIRGKFQDAAAIFADAYQKYPTGTRAADTLLELGKSLDKLGKKPEACATLAQLDKQFKTAASTALKDIKRQAAQEKTQLKCG